MNCDICYLFNYSPTTQLKLQIKWSTKGPLWLTKHYNYVAFSYQIKCSLKAIVCMETCRDSYFSAAFLCCLYRLSPKHAPISTQPHRPKRWTDFLSNLLEASQFWTGRTWATKKAIWNESFISPFSCTKSQTKGTNYLAIINIL